MRFSDIDDPRRRPRRERRRGGGTGLAGDVAAVVLMFGLACVPTASTAEPPQVSEEFATELAQAEMVFDPARLGEFSVVPVERNRQFKHHFALRHNRLPVELRYAIHRLPGMASTALRMYAYTCVVNMATKGAADKPWESAEEREATSDPILQAEVLADWLKVLKRPSVRGVLVWRWFSDPDAGGNADTDFTVQGKPAERMLRCAWLLRCER